ncbi:hypothetical protein ALI22I_44740 [Saccharothrix sp. ALI-22-I]|uniref:SDR family NAD(P)-dependent oxidoreductase n=1 Tax=Saccharothrix sp. ALI-22-I TaxID=1933778 RepID=UPI00097C9CFE|nr:SDR family NAD(P)-dependent oxidoreductase [Saccharothrix sp. ALI-22-I]ONI80423.1 hypothetical protein ALI22I_44740 [Saccharothrix sp. ALI-22-I]
MDVLITGANRGIGRALTAEYLARGARVFAGTRSADGEASLRALKADGTSLRVVRLDVTEEADLAEAARVVEAEAGGLDVLVNNAGVLQQSTGFRDVDPASALALLNVNTLGPLNTARHFAGLLRAGSRMVNITLPTPPVGKVSKPRNHVFVASRYALNALTRMIATELADTGVTVAALWPGYLRTDMNDHAADAAPPDTAAPGLVDLIDRLGPDDHGACVLPDGSHYDW